MIVVVKGREAGLEGTLGLDGRPVVLKMKYLLPFLPRGLFKTDRVVGTTQLKLEALETACEIREILEVGLILSF